MQQVIQDKIQDNLFVLEKLAEKLNLLALITKAGVADLTEGPWQGTNQSLEKLFRQSSYKQLKSFQKDKEYQKIDNCFVSMGVHWCLT